MVVYGEQIVASTLQGLEAVLEKELQGLGATGTAVIKRGVSFKFRPELLYKANFASRLALRFLVPVFQFEADHPDELYKQAMQLPWEQFMDVDQSFAISFAVNSPQYSHGQYASLKLKDAICDRFRYEVGRRPNVQTDQPDISWHLHIYQNAVTISLDSSGDSLHLRGYRRGRHQAPISEVLAAGLLHLAEWDAQFTPLLDGMCGTGTIAIEAAMMASRRAPNLHRRYFPFRNWKDFKEDIAARVRDELIKDSRSKVPEIRAYDISFSAIRTAKMHAEQAGVAHLIHFEKADFLETEAIGPKGLVLLNPPYGERMEVDQLEMLYKGIGDTFKHRYKGWKAGVISSDKSLLKAVRLHSYHTAHLLNGKLPCDFKLYDLY
jgi:putative N6-adenine-specific DNA methylase